MAKLFLIDGSNHAFKAQFALPPQHTSGGFPTRVLYGFTLLLQKLLRTWQPDHVAVAFDHGKTFRHELLPSYKGHRPDMPEDLRQQWPVLPELVRAFGVAVVGAPGFEADDALGTLAARHAGPGLDVVIVTSDKDFAQLVGPHVSLLDESKGILIGEAEVLARWGVAPSQIADLLGLAGDSSDAIPGVAGIGEKTAAQLLQRYGDLDGVLAAAKAGEVSGKRGETLAASEEVARLSRHLATIATEVPGLPDLDGLRPKGLVEAELRPLFERLEFGTVARKLLPAVEAEGFGEVVPVLEADGLDRAVAAIRAAREGAVAARFASGRLADVAWWTGATTFWIPTLARPGVSLDADRARAEVGALLADDSLPKLVFDGKRLARALTRDGLALGGLVGDPKLLDYVLVAHRRAHELEDLAQRHLGHTLAWVPDPEPFDIRAVAKPAGELAAVAGQCHRRLAERLDEGSARVYREIEMPLVPVLEAMEEAGIGLDLGRLGEIREDIRGRASAAEARCHAIVGHPFQVGSTQVVAKVLFEELGLTPTKKLPSGGWSTDSSALEELVDLHPLPAAILEVRQLKKLESTYLDKLPGYVGADGRVHTEFQQAVAATGRLSSVNPNLQNIPIRTAEGRRIREAFVAAPGHVFVSADYSQIELRLLAHITGCTTLVDAFQRGQDIHRRTASEVFGVPLDLVSAEMRTSAKAINFGLLYGMSAFRLARDLGISRAEADAYQAGYFARLPEVSTWIAGVKASTLATQMVRTLDGRRRLLPEITSKNFNERAQAEREAVNTIIQGSAADLIKRAMIRVHAALAGTAARMLLQVHDELLVECPEADASTVGRIVMREMQAAASLAVPLEVTVATGRTWSEAHG